MRNKIETNCIRLSDFVVKTPRMKSKMFFTILYCVGGQKAMLFCLFSFRSLFSPLAFPHFSFSAEIIISWGKLYEAVKAKQLQTPFDIQQQKRTKNKREA